VTAAAARIGAFLRDLPPLFTGEKPVSFDPVQTTFLQKLVRESTLKGAITVAKEDFFRAILYLDWFAEIVAARPAILTDIAVVVEELERMEEYLDPDLTLVVRYSGVYAVKDLRGVELVGRASLEQLARRHERANTRPAARGPAEVDLFHLAVGRFVAEMCAHPELAPALARCEGRADLRALVAMGCLLDALAPGEVGPAVRAALAAGDLLAATGALLGDLVRSSRGFSLAAHVARLHAALVGRA
jgi:hypothetical protein